MAPSVRLNPNHLLADAPLFNAGLELSAGNYDAAIADFGRCLELDPKNQAAALGRATAKLRKNDYAGAIADYNLLLILNPNDLAAYSNRGLARQNTGDVDGAIADFTQVLEANPRYAAIYNNRGFAKMLKADFEGALPDFDQALALGQRDAKTYFNRAKARFAQSDFAGAAADYANGVELQPDANYPRFFFALALRRLQRDDTPAGLAAVVPTWKEGWPKTVGLFLIGNLTEADFLAAAAVDPKSAAPHQCEAFYYAGMAHLMKNETDAARTLFTQCIATGASTLTEYSFARIELALLKQPAPAP